MDLGLCPDADALVADRSAMDRLACQSWDAIDTLGEQQGAAPSGVRWRC
jgi:hypothetical protein